MAADEDTKSGILVSRLSRRGVIGGTLAAASVAVAYAALGDHWTGGIAAIEETNFSHTPYSFRTLIPACQRMAEQVIRRAGGTVTDEAYLIPVQPPKPPAKLEQWTDQMRMLSVAVSEYDMQRWNPAWKLGASGLEMDAGFMPGRYGRRNVLALHPVSRTEPAYLTAELQVPESPHPKLLIDVTSHEQGDFLLRVVVDGELLSETPVDGKGQWETVQVDLGHYSGRKVNVRVEVHASGWQFEMAYLSRIELKEE